MRAFRTGPSAAFAAITPDSARFAAGRRTVNSLPIPGPLLVAATSPPCISTIFVQRPDSELETLGFFAYPLTAVSQPWIAPGHGGRQNAVPMALGYRFRSVGTGRLRSCLSGLWTDDVHLRPSLPPHSYA